jgi:hypothetical protein
MVSPRSRRAVLSIAATGLPAIAGCTGDEATPTNSPTDVHTATDTPTDSETASPTPAPSGTLSLDLTSIDEVDGDLTVYPTDLREWIRTVATSDRTLRTHAETPTYDPSPPLASVQRVHLEDELGDSSGIYDLSVEGDTRYRLLGGAEEVSPPSDGDITAVSDLPETRREFALAAIGAESGDDARVFPETELGSWVRNEFFGGYFSHDEKTYRGKEAQQTDAEFFATEVWYVLSATDVDAPSAPQTLRLSSIDSAVRGVIDDLRTSEDRLTSKETSVEGETAVAVRAFTEEHSHLLTHDAVYRVMFES